MGVSETRQNSEALQRHPKQVGIKQILLDLGSSGQIDEGMVTLTKRRNGLTECRIETRTEDARAGEIVCQCRVGIASGKPERIAESSLSDGVAAEQIHIVLLVLSNETLTARRYRRRQLTGTTLHV